MELIFLEPIFKETIWGGNKLASAFNYEIPSNKTGECWGISAHPNGDDIVKGGTYDGLTLSELYKNHRELFGNITNPVFPLLVKVIDANDDLSVQVHPNDEYANINENGELGKTECWYILDCGQDAEIVIGHNAKNKQELQAMIDDNRWDHLLNRIKLKKGDFFYIPAGTVHAICKNTLILEVQQSSDTTYRLYDYNRLQDGQPRPLHLKQSVDVITYENQNNYQNYEHVTANERHQLIKSEFFTVEKLNVEKSYTLNHEESFLLISVIEGEGTVDGNIIKKGSHFIVPNNYHNLTFEGNMEIVVSYI